MRIRLGRRQAVPLEPYTGKTFCGCRWFHGFQIEACSNHAGRHRAPGDVLNMKGGEK